MSEAATDRVGQDKATKPATRSGWRRAAWIAGSLVALLLLAAGAGWFLLGRVNLASFAAARAAAALGRGVTIGTLHVSPGRWLRVSLSDAKLANLPGGTRESMIELASVEMEVEAASLLRGTPIVRHLTVDGLDVLLEHVGDARNWRFRTEAQGPATEKAPGADRPWLPTVLDGRVVGEVVVRTGQGHVLKTELDGITVTTEAVDRPVRLAGPGAYRGVPITLDATLGSFTAYRDAATPFPTDVTLISGETRLRFEGTMTAPLDVDGAEGRLTAEAPNFEVIERVAGLDPAAVPAWRVEGAFEHQGPAWRLTEATGSVADSRFDAGVLTLREGPPDHVVVQARFEQLDLDALLGERNARSGARGPADLSLRVEKEPATIVEAKLEAKALTYAGLKLAAVTLAASQQPGKVAIDALALSYLGGRIEGKGQVDAAPEGGRVGGELTVAGMEVQALRAVLDMGRLPLTGRVDGHVVVQAAGATLNQAARGARASAVVTMEGGSIAREIVELASTDARALFRTAKGSSAISCALGILDVRAGVGTIAPLRVRTADGTIAGRGTVDLVRHRVDVTIMSESRTTGLFALDVPVRIAGPFADVGAVPAQLSAAGRAQIAAADEPGRLLPALQGAARRSPCLGRR